jgi:hypothetical protein
VGLLEGPIAFQYVYLRGVVHVLPLSLLDRMPYPCVESWVVECFFDGVALVCALGVLSMAAQAYDGKHAPLHMGLIKHSQAPQSR